METDNLTTNHISSFSQNMNGGGERNVGDEKESAVPARNSVDSLTSATEAIRIADKDVEDPQPSSTSGKPKTETGGPEADVTYAHQNVVKDENGFLYYRCRFCGLTFNYMTTLKAHERVHDIDQPFTCAKCDESFHFMCELEYHAKSHGDQKGYKCDCGRTFFQYTDLLYHHHPGEDPEPAGKQPALVQLPAFQPPAIHPTEFPTPEFMKKGFEPKHSLRVYSEVRSKPYICQYCSKSYSDSRGLAYHMYSHRGERIFNPRASRYLMCRNENSYISPGVPL